MERGNYLDVLIYIYIRLQKEWENYKTWRYVQMEMVLWVSQYDATIENFLVVRTWFRVGRPGIWGVDQAPLPANFRNPVRI